ncbi:hypothetical protein AJ79_04061 [Helicocarpus griseus UAMH5409]|uniref:Protein kinase domain-containing protein n=1 Tax=Helicocarpus griseus UAMH5409 TaxID=1447875 RepID=A0A2B7XWF3_9EURO|nr:hypothetical protein AJ79_04061 [Helicocarpus griseus UAMH5409]
MTQMSCESIERERKVYQRLGECDGVVGCLDLLSSNPSGTAPDPIIQMELMENGNLCEYLTRRRHVLTKPLQLSWCRQMAHALATIHDRRVIVADISARNFLLAADPSIVKFSDFTVDNLPSWH